MGDLISREAVLEALRTRGRKLQNLSVTSFEKAISLGVAYECVGIVKDAPAVDAVPCDEYEALLKRFRHLEESNFIRAFDAVNPRTGEYVLNIADADKVQPIRHGRWEVYDYSKYVYCSHCGKPAAKKKNVTWHNYCPICGTMMDGGKADGN